MEKGSRTQYKIAARQGRDWYGIHGPLGPMEVPYHPRAPYYDAWFDGWVAASMGKTEDQTMKEAEQKWNTL